MYGYSLNTNILFYITRVRWYGFYERGRDKLSCFETFYLILTFCGLKKKEQQHCGNYMCQRVHGL
jgi:hypothetical protein